MYLVPILYKSYFDEYSRKCCIYIISSLIFGGICYGMHFPEILAPGYFDYLLHGNQIMHLMLLVAHIYEYDFVLHIINKNK